MKPTLRAPARRALPGWVRGAAGWLVLCALGAVAALALAPPGPYPVGPLEVQPRLTLQPGWTVIEIPPFGELAARTHRAPLGLAVEVRSIDLNALQPGTLEVPARPGDLVAGLRGDIEAAARRFSLRVIVVAGVGALAAAVAAIALGGSQGPGRRPLAVAVATPLIAVLVLGGGIGAVWATYDPDAFGEPEFSGALKSAPWMIGLAEQALRGAERLGERLAAVADGVNAMVERLEAPDVFGGSPGELTVLIVSDIHNNPAAVDLLNAATRAFQADLIIDAGDLTDWGTVIETRLVAGLDQTGIPYLLVPGNHESPGLIAALAGRADLQVLDDGVHEAAGLRIAAVADPAARNPLPAVAPRPERIAAGRRLLAAVQEAGEGGVDVAVAHHPEVAEYVVDRVPVVISGHTHASWVRSTPAGVWINPGTTGAAGIRGLESGRAPYTLMVLHLARDGERWLPVAVDTIRASAFEAGFAVERTVVAPLAAAGEGTAADP